MLKVKTIIFILLFSYLQGSRANMPTMGKILQSLAIDEYVNTVQTWVYKQDQEQFCFGLILENASFDQGMHIRHYNLKSCAKFTFISYIY